MSFDFAHRPAEEATDINETRWAEDSVADSSLFSFFLLPPPEYLGVFFLVSGPDLKRNTDLSADNIGFRKASHAPWFCIPVP